MNYTNAQFRNILNGLGYGSFGNGATDFKLTDDNSPLTDGYTRDYIRKFQQEYKLTVDGIAGPTTMAKARQVITILQTELRNVVNANLPTDQPFYGELTAAAVRQAQSRFFPNERATGVATSALRQRLYSENAGTGQPTGAQAQDNWQWCKKCQGLAFAGADFIGPCPATGSHDHTGSLNYSLLIDSADPQAQDNWRWCRKCQGLTFAGANSVGYCPAGGEHDHTGSLNYSLFINSADDQAQGNWRWCIKCQGLAFAGSGVLGACPAGGEHDHTGSLNYSLLYT